MKKYKQIMEKELKNYLFNENDLLADEDPSLFFAFLIKNFGYLLDPNDFSILTNEAIEKRRKINFVIKKIGPLFLNNKQIMENRYKLLDNNSQKNDNGVELPDNPVIWIANHSFADDILASTLTAYRHSYLLLASLPQVYNTLDCVTSYLNGVVMINRKVLESKKMALSKMEKVIENGADIVMFPEGVWNKDPNKLLLDFWPGVYRLAKECNVKIVPMIHHLSDLSGKTKKDVIHTVIDEPIDVSMMSEQEALTYLRDTMASWLYLMLEKYERTTRNEIVGTMNSSDVWEQKLLERVSSAKRYDREIELCSDYRKKEIIRPEDAFDSIAKLNNLLIPGVIEAKKLVKERKLNDFQRRF